MQPLKKPGKDPAVKSSVITSGGLVVSTSASCHLSDLSGFLKIIFSDFSLLEFYIRCFLSACQRNTAKNLKCHRRFGCAGH